MKAYEKEKTEEKQQRNEEKKRIWRKRSLRGIGRLAHGKRKKNQLHTSQADNEEGRGGNDEVKSVRGHREHKPIPHARRKAMQDRRRKRKGIGEERRNQEDRGKNK